MKWFCRCAAVLWGLLWAALAAAALWGLWANGAAGPPLPYRVCEAALVLAAVLPGSAAAWWLGFGRPGPPGPDPPARAEEHTASRLFFELQKELQRT